ncbi:hypothetical protein [Shewanella sp.]|uniref:hypothetical protein n=1 Tax=Shewanella sp. TaxID=50422 RepID=UPI003A985A3E
MSFANLPVVAYIGGALLLIAALVAMQWLRSRSSVVPIATIQFWIQAAQQAPARVWWQRFRYWLALLLSIVIAILLWTALSGVQLANTHKSQISLYFIDSSVVMQPQHRLADAKTQLLHDISATSAAQRQVWSGDVSASLLLQADESYALLAPRLAGINATAHSNQFSHWLANVVEHDFPTQDIDIYYYGAPLATKVTQALAARIKLHYRYIAPALADNVGIVALGQMPAASGEWGKVDVLFSLFASDHRPLRADMVQFSLNGQAFQPQTIEALGDSTFVLKGINTSAAAQQLKLSLQQGDLFSADDQATLTLARLPVIRVALQAGVPPWIAPLISLSDGATVVDTNADVAVCLTATGCPAAISVLYLDATNNVAQFSAPGDKWFSGLRQQWQQNGWGTLSAAQQFPTLQLASSAERQLHLNLVAMNQLVNSESAQLPRFWLQSLRWLANSDDLTPYLAVDQPWPQRRSSLTTGASVITPMPLLAGTIAGRNGEQSSVSLLSIAISSSVSNEVAATEPELDASAPLSPSPLWCCIVLALLLLLLEWILLQRGRLP